jgi:hypothetical protein
MRVSANPSQQKHFLAAASICALFALLTLIFILVNGVNVPFADEWWYASLVKSVRSGTATFDTFWSPNNEHRMLIPRLEFSALAVLTHWRSKVMLVAGWTAATGAAVVLLSQFGKIYLRDHPKLWVAGTSLSAASLFSLVQLENWLWAFQFTFFFIQFTVIASLIVLCRPTISLWLRIPFAATLGVAASFSSAQGLLIWPPLLLTLALTDDSLRNKLLGALFILASGAVTFVFYFSGMQRTTELHLTKEQFLQKFQLPLFGFFGLLGNPLSHWISYEHLPHRSWFVGLSLTVLFLFLIWTVYKRRRLPDASPWIGLGTYACLFCLATTYGRLGMGYTGGFLSSRYTTHAVLLPIAIIALLLIAIDATDNAGAREANWLYRMRLPTAISVVIVIGTLIAIGDFASFNAGFIDRNDRLLAKRLIPFVTYFDPEVDGTVTGPLYPLCPLMCQTIFNNGVKELCDAGYLHQLHDVDFKDVPSDVTGKYAVNQRIAQRRYLGINETGWKLFGTITARAPLVPDLIFLSPAGRPSFIAAAELRKMNKTPDGKLSYKWDMFLSPFILADPRTPLQLWVYNKRSNAFLKVSQNPEQWEKFDQLTPSGGRP